jgi:pantoate--beta-alanine ligase
MKIYRTVEEMRAATRQARREGKRVGLVPTMGALHEGHLSLVRAARANSDYCVVSIFVNPLQFGPKEDLATYPRPFEKDTQLLAAEKVDAVFAPSAEEMYPASPLRGEHAGEGFATPAAPASTGSSAQCTFVEVPELSERLDGRSRPGHFRGVATVVAKLFLIVQPNVAFFGQKDAAQVAVLRRMARDLNFGVELRVMPIVRERDGLAMSSRNAYLNPEQRKQALVLHRALLRVQAMADRGEHEARKLCEIGRDVMAEEPAAKVDYFEIVDPETLEPVERVGSGALVAVAAWIGTTRLIDNALLTAPAGAKGPEMH